MERDFQTQKVFRGSDTFVNTLRSLCKGWWYMLALGPSIKSTWSHTLKQTDAPFLRISCLSVVPQLEGETHEPSFPTLYWYIDVEWHHLLPLSYGCCDFKCALLTPHLEDIVLLWSFRTEAFIIFVPLLSWFSEPLWVAVGSRCPIVTELSTPSFCPLHSD